MYFHTRPGAVFRKTGTPFIRFDFYFCSSFFQNAPIYSNEDANRFTAGMAVGKCFIKHEMTELLIKKIREYVIADEQDIAVLDALFVAGTIEKGAFLHRDGDIVQHAVFVEKGLFRTFIIDEQGVEHILQFAMEGWWTGDLASFITGKASRFYIEALEDSEILRISKASWGTLLEKAPFFLDYHRKLVERSLIATQERLLESYSVDARQKYIRLLQSFPDILQRVPQYMIASYLGMSRETLSRVRSQIASEK